MINNLKFPPLRNRSIPDKLIYKQITGNKNKKVYIYNIFKTEKNNTNYGTMKCSIGKIDRDGLLDVPSLYISSLKSKKMGEGLGSTLLEIAKKKSRQLGLNGFIHLDACPIDVRRPSPHVFYRKNGLVTHSKFLDWKINYYVKRHKMADAEIFFPTEMFYPPSKKKGLYAFIMELFKFNSSSSAVSRIDDYI